MRGVFEEGTELHTEVLYRIETSAPIKESKE